MERGLVDFTRVFVAVVDVYSLSVIGLSPPNDPRSAAEVLTSPWKVSFITITFRLVLVGKLWNRTRFQAPRAEQTNPTAGGTLSGKSSGTPAETSSTTPSGKQRQASGPGTANESPLKPQSRQTLHKFRTDLVSDSSGLFVIQFSIFYTFMTVASSNFSLI